MLLLAMTVQHVIKHHILILKSVFAKNVNFQLLAVNLV